MFAQLCLALYDPMDCRPPGSTFYEIPRQEYWSTPGKLPDPGTEPWSLTSPAWRPGFFTTVPPGKPVCMRIHIHTFIILVHIYNNTKMFP